MINSGLHKRIIIIGAVLTALIFVVDINLPLGVAGGVPYVAVVLLSLWMPKSRNTVVAAISGVLFTLLGWLLSPPGGVFWIVATNRFFAIFGIMVAALFILRYKRSEQELQESRVELEKLNDELEERVNARTKQVRESQELYQAIARNYPNGTINVLDKDLRYTFVEGKELYKLGVTSEQLMGTSYYERLPEQVRDEIKENLLKVFSGSNLSFEVAIQHNTYVLNAVPLRDENGKIKLALVVEQNITKQKKAEEGIQKALENEQNVNELKSRFVSMASHEFRTPLSTILSSVSLLEEYLLPEHADKREKHITRIKSSIHNLTNILNDFLSLDKIEAGKLKSNPEKFDITELIKSVIDQMSSNKKNGQEVHYEHSGSSKMVNIDKQMMKNVTINLLSNAIKYSAENQLIVVASIIEKGQLKMQFEDHGVGIPEKDQRNMFERFFRAGNVTNIEGTGLGLNIVSKYVSLMHGSISFSSVENEGSVFTIEVPVG